jgi:protein-S-isoprenylcysteine O-methyltransferase Ste14
MLVALAVLLFLPAFTLTWWRAWLFLAVFGAGVAAITAYFLRADPALIERRMNAGPGGETEPTQRIVQLLAAVAFMAVFVVAGLDRNFGWTQLPGAVALLGDLMVAVGLWIVFRVFRENTYTAATVTVDAGQTVVTTGPYGWVRHPMYAGAIVMMVGVALALGSGLALLPVATMVVLMVVRLLDEERFLVVHLAGYDDYRRATRFRLVPGLW